MKHSKLCFLAAMMLVCSLTLALKLRAEESYERFTVRDWTYRDGTEATGKLISVTGPNATLKLDGKGTVRVPLEKLSVKDLNWIYEYHKRRKQLNFLPPEYRKPQVAGSQSKPESNPEPKPEDKPAASPEPEKSMTAPAEPVESYQPFTLREWTLKDGKTHQAKFLSINQTNIVLQSDEAGILKLTLDQLSQKDLHWFVEYHRRKNLQAFLPKELRELGNGKPLVSKEGTEPGKVPPTKIEMNNPLKPGENPLAAAQDKMKALQEKHQEEMREKLKADSEKSAVVKADTTIDPKLAAVFRDMRVWTDKKGQKSEARFHGINGREAMFVGAGVGFIRVHLGTLSEDDLQLLREALKMHGRMAELPFVYRDDLDPNLSTMKLKQVLRVNNHRQWTDLSGNKVGASYVKMEDGVVTLLITATGTPQEFPYRNFSAEDQEFVQERLKKETAGNFFPETPADANLTLTPEEQKEEFRIWTDRKNRKIKGKFVRLAYGTSVAVINTGKKEELFITEFFSDPDLSLIKPRKQKEKQGDQLAMNGGGRPQRGAPGQFFREMTNRDAFPNQGANMDMGMSRESMFPKRTFSCPLCDKTHQSESIFFTECPHCQFKSTDSLYTCKKCSRKFKTDFFQGTTAPCPYCNKNVDHNNPLAHNPIAHNPNPFPAGGGGNGEKMYTCEQCNLQFAAKGHGNTAPCPKCNSKFNASTNFWTAIVRLGIALVILLGGGGGYYRYSNR